jgi:hypothetical protein
VGDAVPRLVCGTCLFVCLFVYLFIYLFHLQNDNGHAKKEVTMKVIICGIERV